MLTRSLVLLACFSALTPTVCVGQNFVDQHIAPVTLQVERIEEDWVLQIGDPDPKVTAPQITTTMSPNADLTGVHAIFNLNHQAQYEFAPGGMQLQVWNGETAVSFHRIRPDEVFETSGETVRWTQVMDLTSAHLKFTVINGESSTWGEFGGTNLLSEKVATNLVNLNDYNPMDSAENSGVTYAGNRVDSLVLKTVRVYTTDGQEFTIHVDINVDHN